MIRWGCFSSGQICKSDKQGSGGLRRSHRDAWLEFGTISFGPNFFDIVGTLWSASALFLQSAKIPKTILAPEFGLLTAQHKRWNERTEGVWGIKPATSGATWTREELRRNRAEKPWGKKLRPLQQNEGTNGAMIGGRICLIAEAESVYERGRKEKGVYILFVLK